MQLGMVGLGRMGANLTRRLMRGGHEVVVYDVNADSVSQLESEGSIGTGSLEDFVSKLSKPRAAWVMVPAAFAEQTTDALAELMEAGDVVIDGGNSYYRDDVDRAERYGEKGVHFVDVGTSGGVFGLERGFCLMIGGEDEIVRHLDPIFATIAPGVGAAERTPGRTDANRTTAEAGYLHCGTAGAGHFVKMVHNGIEYGLMAAYAEGLNVLKHAGVGAASARPTPRPRLCAIRSTTATTWTSPRSRRCGDAGASWRRGCWTSRPRRRSRTRAGGVRGRVSDSGEGRWTVLAAVDEGVPVHVLSAALFDRFESRAEADFANRVLSAMRKQFGGHAEKTS